MFWSELHHHKITREGTISVSRKSKSHHFAKKIFGSFILSTARMARRLRRFSCRLRSRPSALLLFDGRPRCCCSTKRALSELFDEASAVGGRDGGGLGRVRGGLGGGGLGSGRWVISGPTHRQARRRQRRKGPGAWLRRRPDRDVARASVLVASRLVASRWCRSIKTRSIAENSVRESDRRRGRRARRSDRC